MLPLICIRVRACWATKQAQAHYTALYIMSIFTIIEETYTVIAFADIDPLMSASFKACPIPTGIAMSGPLNIAPLDFIGSDRCKNVDRESGLEQNMTFVPVNLGMKVYTAAVVAQ